MKKTLITLSMISVFALYGYAQTDYSDYLNKAMEKVEAGDCDAAQRFYNVYKELTGNTSSWLEKAIKDCVGEKCNSQRAIPAGYVDLGLPSGTLWKTYNENGFFSYYDAVNRFGTKLPTRNQFDELIENCTWSWNGSGYKITGPNGNFIVLPAAGSRTKNKGDVEGVGSTGTYWSSISKELYSDDAFCLSISSTYHFTLFHYKRHGFSVRLVWNY